LRFSLLIASILFISCTAKQPKSIAELEQDILKRPIVGSVDFYQKNDSSLKGFQHQDGSYEYFFIEELNDSISNGFYGPRTDAFDFDQIISFDIESDNDWEIVNQTAFPGRLVQNSKKGVFSVSHTLFFSDDRISINIYSIKNTDFKKQEVKPEFTYYINSELSLEKRKGFGARFLSDDGEYWPHSSGDDIVSANEDSTIFTKKVPPVLLLPKEELELYSIVYIQENLDSILKSPRPKPWMCFPNEELAKNSAFWGNKLSE